MIATKRTSKPTFNSIPGAAPWSLATGLATLLLIAQCSGQGTMTITFDTGSWVAPPGERDAISSYSESGIDFWNPYGLENLVSAGGGVAGYPDDGTAYLQVSQGARLGFRSLDGSPFDLLSLDLAEYATYAPGPGTLQIIGYTTPALYPGVTTNLTVGTLSQFQTFTLDSRFEHLYQVDILNDYFSLDNVVLGVPEPSAGGLILLGTLCGLGWRWMRRRLGRVDGG